jgi:hypothetical protein
MCRQRRYRFNSWTPFAAFRRSFRVSDDVQRSSVPFVAPNVLADNRPIFGFHQLAVIPSAPAEFRLPVVLLCAQRDFQPTREYPAGTPQSNLDVAAGPQKLQDLLDPERLRSLHDQLLRPQFA